MDGITFTCKIYNFITRVIRATVISCSGGCSLVLPAASLSLSPSRRINFGSRSTASIDSGCLHHISMVLLMGPLEFTSRSHRPSRSDRLTSQTILTAMKFEMGLICHYAI